MRRLILSLLLAIFVAAPAPAADINYVPYGQTVSINELGVCRKITNNSPSSQEIMVPAGSHAEWDTSGNSFLENLPPGVTATPCNCTIAAGTTWTVSGNTCTVPSEVSITDGNTGSATDTTPPTTGSATYACNARTATITGTPTCTTAATGSFYCWGLNGNGQIGDGTASPRGVPTAGTWPSGVTAYDEITAGGYEDAPDGYTFNYYGHSCGIANGGTNAGRAYCGGGGALG